MNEDLTLEERQLRNRIGGRLITAIHELKAEGISDHDILMGMLALAVGTMTAEFGHGAAAAELHQIAHQLDNSGPTNEGVGHC